MKPLYTDTLYNSKISLQRGCICINVRIGLDLSSLQQKFSLTSNNLGKDSSVVNAKHLKMVFGKLEYFERHVIGHMRIVAGYIYLFFVLFTYLFTYFPYAFSSPNWVKLTQVQSIYRLIYLFIYFSSSVCIWFKQYFSLYTYKYLKIYMRNRPGSDSKLTTYTIRVISCICNWFISYPS